MAMGFRGDFVTEIRTFARGRLSQGGGLGKILAGSDVALECGEMVLIRFCTCWVGLFVA